MNEQNVEMTGYPSIDKPWLKYYSEEAINTQIPSMTMYQYAYNKNKKNMSTQCFDYFGKKIYYAGFFEKVKLVAGNLQRMGVVSGDIVTIMSMHTPETLITIYAINYIGAIANMVYMTISEKEVIDIIKNTDSKLFFALDIAMEKVNEIEKHIDIPIVILEVSDSMPIYLKCALKLRKILKRNNYIKFGSMLKNAQNEYEIKQCKDNLSTAIIVYTSGTTGEPKGVMLSNDCINAIAYQCSLTDKNYKRGETYLACIPPFLGFGITMAHLGISEGLVSQLVLNPDINYIVKRFAKLKSNRLVYGPRITEVMIEKLNCDLSHLLDFTGGGEAISKDNEIKINKFLEENNANAKYTTGYGMTETGSVVTLNSNKIYRLGSVGVPLPLSNIKIVEDGVEKKYNQIGEICLNSPSVMQGYFKNDKATKDVIELDEDGNRWLHTGDLGYVDEDGFLFITGRKKRIYTVFGNDNNMYKLFPQRIEEYVSSLSQVNSCAVVVLEDKEKLHKAIAYIELKSLDDCCEETKKEIFKSIRCELPEHMIPENIKFVSEIPLTTSGKVDYRRLEEEAENR